jgi:hypothetical protein
VNLGAARKHKKRAGLLRLALNSQTNPGNLTALPGLVLAALMLLVGPLAAALLLAGLVLLLLAALVLLAALLLAALLRLAALVLAALLLLARALILLAGVLIWIVRHSGCPPTGWIGIRPLAINAMNSKEFAEACKTICDQRAGSAMN